MKFMRFKQVAATGLTPRDIVVNMAHVQAIVPDEETGSVLQMEPYGDGHANNWHVTETIDEIGARPEWVGSETTAATPSTNRGLATPTDRLRAALEEIVSPVDAIQRRAMANGEQLNGSAAVQLAESAAYLQGIAAKALLGINQQAEKSA